jgi:hypothetical protein
MTFHRRQRLKLRLGSLSILMELKGKGAAQKMGFSWNKRGKKTLHIGYVFSV